MGIDIVYPALIIEGCLLLSAGFYLLKKKFYIREKSFLTDTLTGGYNREGFLQTSSHYVNKEGCAAYTVICLNINNFRYINETWGEAFGNQMLQFIYRILADHITEKELVCRSDIDHFLLLLHENDEAAAAARVERMVKEISRLSRQKFAGYKVEFTIGGCRLSIADTISLAINNAFYMSKKHRDIGRCTFYSEETAKKIAEENELYGLFDESIKNHDFEIYLQPKVPTAKNEPCQAEALVRWFHPKRGLISPGQFIPLLEKSGKIDVLDLYVFDEICRLTARQIRDGKEPTKISVNISRYHLKNAGPDVWKKYKKIKDQYQIPDGLLEIELTETVLIDRSQLSFAKYVLDSFRSFGLNVALDDFGFGFSSLALLKEFDVETLKLDKGFFSNENEKSKKIVEGIILLAHNLDMCVVAEGIEKKDQVEALREFGCDLIQGYVYSKPLPINEFEKWRNAYEQ